MSIFFVPLKEYVVDPHQAIDLTSIPTSEAIAYIKKGQGFLANAPDVSINDGIIRIEFPEESKKKVEEALDYFQRGIRKAKQGDHKGAIQLLSKTLGILPYHTEARRNLAMANLELGDVEEARNQLIDVLRLDPKDAWGYLLLGNTYFMS